MGGKLENWEKTMEAELDKLEAKETEYDEAKCCLEFTLNELKK
jgi:hypothetical protein